MQKPARQRGSYAAILALLSIRRESREYVGYRQGMVGNLESGEPAAYE